jgi:glutamate dehydrogenase
VRRHFLEMGKDIQAEPFTVVGIGDMSGDVFGNGMLLSRQIRLLAAFDHRDIFLDPDPDPETGYRERERLFALGRSSWQDYDRPPFPRGDDHPPGLQGGGAHPRGPGSPGDRGSEGPWTARP